MKNKKSAVKNKTDRQLLAFADKNAKMMLNWLVLADIIIRGGEGNNGRSHKTK